MGPPMVSSFGVRPNIRIAHHVCQAPPAPVRFPARRRAPSWVEIDRTFAVGRSREQGQAVIFSGPPVLIFGARWCPPCITKIPAVVRLEETMERLGAQVLSIAWRDPPGAEMDAFIEERGITYPVYYDVDDAATGSFGVWAIQANFVLDAEDRVRFERPALVDIPRQVGALAKG